MQRERQGDNLLSVIDWYMISLKATDIEMFLQHKTKYYTSVRLLVPY